MSDEARTARDCAERALDLDSTGLRPAGALLLTGRRLGWALLDVADAIRHHAETTRPPKPPAFTNRWGGR